MKLLDYMREHILLLDGGMGTLLQAQGLAPGAAPERWNLTKPETVAAVHTAYFNAGSNVVAANTFGANLLRFEAGELREIIGAAVKNARDAAKASVSPAPKWVALDIGPTGRLLEPLGDLPFERAVEVFAATVREGVRAGVDLIFIETMNDMLETKAALLAAKENSTLPVFVSNAYGENGKLLTGASPAAMVALLEGMGAAAIGVNCSFGPKQLMGVVEEYLRCASVPVLVKPNAGLPRAGENGATVYDLCAADFAEDTARMLRMGAAIAGGCCGTTPEYIRRLAEKSADIPLRPAEKKTFALVSSYTHAVRLDDTPVLIGERINPTGKKRLKQAILENDIDYILTQGVREADAGAHILDVNVGVPGIDEAAVLKTVVQALQAVCDAPLQIDTASPAAMEAALRVYNGKPLLNSVTGKEESMRAVFPLAKKYGGVIVALTLDENGVPETAAGRLAIAKRIVAAAEDYGIDRRELLFDPLALTVSAAPDAAAVTLESLRLIRVELGCRTSLGVSNVSFGLPAREVLNASFFTLAMANGLSAAIMNPDSVEMQKAYRAYLALTGRDDRFAGYLSFAAALPKPGAQATAAGSVPSPQAREVESLSGAVEQGRKERAAALAAAALEHTAPLELIAKEIVPALDRVGVKYERQEIYLPQLLMSAEAAKSAFEVIKARVGFGSAAAGPGIVIATVQGDVHDIGKNIVKLLLENYGFRVIDLGKDVPPEAVVAAVTAEHAPLCGLSALMTTTLPAMEQTVALLKAQAPFCRTIVGGAVLSAEYAKKIGADYYAADAMETVRIAMEEESINDKR